MKTSELRRAEIVKRLLNLDLSTKKELQDIVQLTSVICKTPIVLITLLDEQLQHIEFKVGLDTDHTPLEDAFCKYTIGQKEIMEVKDL